MTTILTLQQIAEATLANSGLFKTTSLMAWARAQDRRGAEVALYRQYIEGEHRISLSPEMKKMLRMVDGGVLNQFNLNYTDIVVQTMVDRMQIADIDVVVPSDTPKLSGEAADPAATYTSASAKVTAKAKAKEWVDELLEINRFDAMQGDLTEACVRDGDTFLLEYWDNDEKRVCFSEEPAWDGNDGMVVYYESRAQLRPSVALKVWRVGVDSSEEELELSPLATVFVNVYWPDHVEHWSTEGSGALMRLASDFLPDGTPNPDMTGWTLRDGSPIGLPVVHYANRKTKASNYGRGEIKNAVPIQDSINRTLISALMACDLTAFGIYYALGFEPPAGLTPGMWIKAGHARSDSDSSIVPPSNADEAAGLNAVRIGKLDPSPLAPYLDQLRYLAGEMGKITRTPAPEFMGGDDTSGEALKQRETPLLGKVRRAQTKLGNAWEDAMSLAHRIEQAFATDQPPAIKRFNTQWNDPEIRNDQVTIQNAMLIADKIGDRQFLRIIAKVYDWDEATIDQILLQRNKDVAQRVASIGGNLPNFSSFQNFDQMRSN